MFLSRLFPLPVSHFIAQCIPGSRLVYGVLGALGVIALAASAGNAWSKPYKGAEIYSAEATKYGRYVMRMRMAKGSGVLSTFFTYKNGSEVAGTVWEEIDIEVLGKNEAYQMQSNIILGTQRQTTEGLHTIGRSLADDYHTYTLEWTPEYVAWFIDGQEMRRINGTQFVSGLTSPQTMRFNIWASTSEPWVGAFNPSILPVYQFVNYMEYYAYNPATRSFTLSWRDDFNSFNSARWSKADWTFDGNYVDFDPANVVVRDGTLILALTTENARGFFGTVPVDGNTSSRASSSLVASSIPASSSAPSSRSIASSSLASSTSNQNGGQCNWYGTLYPLCAVTTNGWGYENNRSCISRTTCAAQPAPFGIVGGNSSMASSRISSSMMSTNSIGASSSRSVTPSSASNSSAVNNASGLACTARAVNNWGSGYQLEVIVANNGTVAVNSWSLTLTFNTNPQRTGGWNANFGGSGNVVTASNLSWNGNVAPGGSVSFGLQGNHSGGFVAPICRVN